MYLRRRLQIVAAIGISVVFLCRAGIGGACERISCSVAVSWAMTTGCYVIGDLSSPSQYRPWHLAGMVTGLVIGSGF